MNTNDFIQKALITESTVDTVEVNRKVLNDTLGTLIAAGNVLDVIKKNTFYGRPIDHEKLQNNLLQIQTHARSLANTTTTELAETDQLVNVNPRIFHSIIGVTTESIELLEALDLSQDTLDSVNLLEETFDVDWYQCILIDELDGDLEQIWQTGLDKLQNRYQGTFDSTKANYRDTDTERKTLEDGLS